MTVESRLKLIQGEAIKKQMLDARRYEAWKRSGGRNVSSDAVEDEMEMQAKVIYSGDATGRALTQAYLAGARAHAAFLTGSAMEAEVTHKGASVDFKTSKFTNTGLNMPPWERPQVKG